MADPGLASKFIEMQIEDAARGVELSVDNVSVRKLKSQLETLRLSRARLVAQLEFARSENHREILERGLKAVESEMGDITQLIFPPERN